MADTDNNITEVIVGAGVLAVAVGFFLYAAQASGVARDPGAYPLTASFRSAEGIAPGTEVRMAGVRIGTVTDLVLDPASFRAETTFTVRDGIALPDDSAVSISSEGLLGGSFLEVIPGGSPFVLEPGDVIVDTRSSVSLIPLLMRFVGGDGSE